MFHLHLVGRRGSSYSIALISQWIALSLARRDDIRLTFAELEGQPRQSAQGLFSADRAAILDAIPDLAPGEVPDVEVRMASQYKDPGSGDHPKLLYVFAEARGQAVLERLPPRDVFERRSGIGLLMPSLWVRKAFAEQGVAEARLHNLGVGIDTETYAPSAQYRALLRQQLGIDGIAIMNVSGMWRAKGIAELLIASGMLISEGHNIRLILKGNDGIYASKQMLTDILNSFPRAHGKLLARHISYIGREMSMQDMAALYNAADIYVSPYWAEGFNMPVLEAIACGVPVVCTGGGSTDDFTSASVARHIRAAEVDSDIGRVLQPDTGDLVRHLRAVCADTAFRHEVRVAGPRHVAAAHTWDLKAAELVAIARDWSATVRSGASLKV
jgi:glycosyltransferase involved in cell wall biosynthesis